jgi:hypothetical protein
MNDKMKYIQDSGFKYTPKPRDLTDIEADKYYLRYSDGGIINYSIETTLTIWAAAATEIDPVYRLYNRGTNNLLILRYDWGIDEWQEIKYNEIKNIYGLLWLLCIK